MNMNNEPEYKIDVQREYDEDGNLKRYDSTYIYSWSGPGNIDLDSVMKNFKNNFDFDFLGPDMDFHSYSFDQPLFNDSTGSSVLPENFHHYFHSFNFPEFKDFFHEDFFNSPGNENIMKRFFEDHQKMMDLIRKRFGTIPHHFEYNFDSIPSPDTNPYQNTPAEPKPKKQSMGLEI